MTEGSHSQYHFAIDSVTAKLTDKSSAGCQILEPCYIMLTVVGTSNHAIRILGDKLRVTATPLSKPAQVTP